MPMADEDRLDRLCLARTDGIGAVKFGQLLHRCGSAGAALRELRDPFPRADARAEMEQAEAVGARHILLGDADYPALLALLDAPPPVLVIRGDIGLAARPVVAMVGARNASAAGRKLAYEMALALSEAGWVVASGLARGVDAAAHQAALERGTIACVGGGLDIAYPPEHAQLQAEIGERGLLVSEMPPGTEPQARHFPRRNRLIAGLSNGVVVVEAAPGSGSLITARLAAEASREVMAVPGHPADPRSRGGNGLIRDGAVLVECAADILGVLEPFRLIEREVWKQPQRQQRKAPPKPLADSMPALPLAPASDFLGLLSISGVSVDELVRASGLRVAEVQARLSDLEIDGRVVRLPGGRVALAA